MDNDTRLMYEPTTTAHPGEIIVEYLEFNNWSQRDLARRTGLTPKTISEICNGKAPITPQTSLALEKVFQRPARFWLSLQRQFDEAEARQRIKSKLEAWKDWATRFPLKEMKRFGWFAELGKEPDVEGLLSFFGVSSPDSWDSVWKASDVAYRQTRKFRINEEAISAWVRATELDASQMEIKEFDEKLLRASLDDLRRLTRERPEESIPKMRDLCAAAGVAFVLVPELPNTGISGCARWLSDKKAMIALTLRYKFDDQIWFTFFHECAHLLLHSKEHGFILDNAAEDLTDNVVDPQMQRQEEEANRFAADTLIPPAMLDSLIKEGDFSNEAIHRIAEKLEIGPGIVVGRLQHEKLLKPHQGIALKQRFIGKTLADLAEKEVRGKK
jgi:HTH-type transcriptional regulator / antitoxin HigA